MAQKQIIWTQRAEEELYNILEFYTERNKSPAYSKKLLSAVEKLSTFFPRTNI